MSVKFLHTADWQIGKPFAGIEDVQKRAVVQQERINVLQRLASAVREHQAQFVVMAGDLFDSSSPTKATVSAACSAIGAMQVPVFVIPGNHDHGGPGSIWEQAFFTREKEQLAPNLQILLSAEPVVLESAVLFPCPLLRRHESADPTTWLRSMEERLDEFGEKPRIVLAHGTVQGFASQDDEDGSEGSVPNFIDLARFTEQAFDYYALGDWHGMKQVGAKAWYPGTPEPDRFPKGEDNRPGHVLIVSARRNGIPDVTPLATARLGWHQLAFDLADDADLVPLTKTIAELIGNRTSADLLRLELRGSLGIAAATQLERQLESWEARFLRLKLYDQTVTAPTAEEAEALTRRPGDPLISRVAAQLVARAKGAGEEAAVARTALRELYAACNQQ